MPTLLRAEVEVLKVGCNPEVRALYSAASKLIRSCCCYGAMELTLVCVDRHVSLPGYQVDQPFMGMVWAWVDSTVAPERRVATD